MKKQKNLSTHGMQESRDNVGNFGYVSRMDNLQAGILNYRLKNLKKLLKLEEKTFQFILKI